MKSLSDKSLSDKTALVTGASRGMGRAAALALAAAGARVVVHYGRNADEAKSVVDQIRAAGGRADALAADLAAPDGAHKLAAQVRDLVGGRLDIIVANAGISKAASIEDTSVADFDNLFAVNVRAPYFLVQQLLPILGEGSSIVLLSSLGAHVAVGALSAYAATKGAVDTLVKYFASALGPRGIRVNAVAPGVIDTDMSNLTKTEEGRTAVKGMQALKRIGEPDDVASVVAFLASNDARWITGDTINVDGGSKL
jgi:NAD(P)-dependent dehydrogenase (short-subunit alcohol dehydrogenase family)